MKAALQDYHARMQRVLDHIDRRSGPGRAEQGRNLLEISFLAAVHGDLRVSVHRYVQLVRMKRATHQLAYMDAQSVTDIAMDAGYGTPDAFARAFRQRFRHSPSSFRKSPDWEPRLSAFEPLDNARSKLMRRTFTTDDVTIRDVPLTLVAIMEHRGDPATFGATIQRFIAWRTAAGLHPKTSPAFNIWRSERRPASAANYSADLCVGTDQPIEANGEQIKAGEIPGGRRALLRVVATPTIRSLSRSTFIATGFRPAARKHATSRSIASG